MAGRARRLDRLPGGNGAALSTPACAAYSEALARLRAAYEHRLGARGFTRCSTGCCGGSANATRGASARARALDFEDLELSDRELLRSDAELRERYRDRFEQVMVDELQDTNAGAARPDRADRARATCSRSATPSSRSTPSATPTSSCSSAAASGLRAGGGEGDAADQLPLAPRDPARCSTPAFEPLLGDAFQAARAGARTVRRRTDPRVELLVADKGADWALDGLASPWRIAEARALVAHGSPSCSPTAPPRASRAC